MQPIMPDAVSEDGRFIYRATEVLKRTNTSKADFLKLLWNLGLLELDDNGQLQPTDYALESGLLVRMDDSSE